MNIKKTLLLTAGSAALSLGIIGIFVPLLPTTPLVLLSLYCYSKSSQRLHDKVLNNRYLGKYIRDYVEKRGVQLPIKIYTLALLWLAIGCSALFLVTTLWVKLLLVAIAIGVSIHIFMLKTLKKGNR